MMKIRLAIFFLLIIISPAFAQYSLQPVLSNVPSFSNPTEMLFIPDGSARMIVLEQYGKVWIVDGSSGTPASRIFFDGSQIVTRDACEAGMLGCAFHPDFIHNHFVYLSYDTGSNGNWFSHIVRYQVSSSNPDSLIPSSAYNIITFAQPFGFCNHKGGCIRFGPDGYLYAAFGDGGNGGDPYKNGQNRSVLLGKIIRIDIDHEADGNHYAIPVDNPFANNTQGFKKEIFAYGLRNTWKFSFDKATGKLWAGDVGQDAYEEVDIITAGGNYGWNVMEGFHFYGSPTDTTGMILPIWEYPHSAGQAITGGFIYHGTSILSLVGKYIYADYVKGHVWALSYSGSSPAINQQLVNGSGKNISISVMAEDPQGEIYAMDFVQGKILKLSSKESVNDISSSSNFEFTADRTFLDANHPLATIHYHLPENQSISLTLIDEAGREVKHLYDGKAMNGEYQLRANSLSDGMYLIRLKGNSGTTSLKIIVQK